MEQNKRVNENHDKEEIKRTTKKEDEKLPLSTYLHVIACLSIYMTEYILTISVYAYIADLIVDFGVVSSVNDSGLYSGWTMTLYWSGKLVSSIFWSYISSKFGRRPVLLFGSFSIILITIGFAFSFNYYYFIFLHFLLGVFCSGNDPVTKVSICELVPSKYYDFVFSFYVFGYSFSAITGFLFGGFLSRPFSQYSFLSDSFFFSKFKSVFSIFPFYLNNIVLAFIFVLIFIFSCFFLQETKHLSTDKEENEVEVELEENKSKENSEEETLKIVPKAEEVEKEEEEKGAEKEEIKEEGEEKEGKPNNETKEEKEDIEEKEDERQIEKEGEQIGENKENEEKTKSVKGIKEMFSFTSTITLVVYFLIAASGASLYNVMPVFVTLGIETKGLGLINYEIGIIECFAGIIGIIAALCCPFIIKFITPVWCVRIVPLIFIFFVPFYPELSYLVKSDLLFLKILMWIILLIFIIIREFSYQIMYTSIMIMLNNVIHRKNRAIFGGIAQCYAGIARAVTPPICGILLSLSLKVNIFPIDIHLFFLVTCFFLILLIICSFFLPVDLKFPRENLKYPQDKGKDGKRKFTLKDFFVIDKKRIIE